MRRTRLEPTDPNMLSDAGKQEDPYDEGLVGIPPLEAEPRADDILPDQIRGPDPDDENLEITARPKEPERPIPPDELPEG